MHRVNGKSIRLIVNADDYGYFNCISQGILAVAKSGNLSATGVLGNAQSINEQLLWLDAIDSLDIGVHLNLSYQYPLTRVMSEKLSAWEGKFPGVFQMTRLILSGRISIKDIRSEWIAQIEACRGRKLMFLNSHEHIHMLPALFRLTLELAQKFYIPNVRLTQPEWWFPCGLAAVIRNGLMQILQTFNQVGCKISAPFLIGLSHSGRLELDYLEKVFSRLKPGNSYELMCHPGYFNANEITDQKLIAYHDWQKELALLQSLELQELYRKFNISLVNY
jgi:predicted glycoside hydrolase/deacetylase ChbG (UPF0249 family)